MHMHVRTEPHPQCEHAARCSGVAHVWIGVVVRQDDDGGGGDCRDALQIANLRVGSRVQGSSGQWSGPPLTHDALIIHSPSEEGGREGMGVRVGV